MGRHETGETSIAVTALAAAHGEEAGLPAAAYHQPGQASYRRLILALFAAGVATFAALYSTQPLLGVLAQQFAIPASRAAWSVSAATLLLGIGMVTAGPLSNRYGRVRIIKGSLAATAVLGAACALAPSWPVLLFLRAGQGLALAGVPAVAMVYLREEVHVSVHPRTAGLYIAGNAIGGMTGRLLAGGVADLIGWRWALGGIAVLSGLCAVAAIKWLPASRHHRTPGRQQSRHAVTGAGATALAIWRQSARDMARVLRDGQLIRLDVIAFVAMGAFVAVYNVLGLRLTSSPFHLSVFEASLVFAVYPLGSAASALAGRLAEKTGRPIVILAGSLIAVAGVAVTLGSALPMVVAGVAVITAGFFAVQGVASGWAAAVGQRRHQAASEASACYLIAYYLGSSVFGVVGTALWTSGRWPAVAAMAGGLLLVPAALTVRHSAATHS
jgi:MFS transporter, YNFM family, putative membrane transport protein